MKGRCPSPSPSPSPVSLIVVFVILVWVGNSDSLEFDSVGRAVRNQLGTLYSLRNKLRNGDRDLRTSTTSSVISTPEVWMMSRGQKESRGYEFHHSGLEISNPRYEEYHQFENRMGRIDDESHDENHAIEKGPRKWRKQGKGLSKKESFVRSFNIYHHKSNSSGSEMKNITLTTDRNKMTESIIPSSSSKPIVSQPLPPTTTPPSTLTQIQILGQGLNNAMTTILMNKLVRMIDHDVPPGLFTPLKHLVASGNQMIEYWDKKSIARDTKSPGIVEMLGYGLEELKKFRDGQSIKFSDPVVNLTSPAKTLIQGMITVKKLTNRVLGYDTSNEVVESRGGYGHGHDSYGHGGGGYGHMSYGHYLDPYAILATLGFGVFLFNVIFNLMNNNIGKNNMAMSTRSLHIVDLDVPLGLTDLISNPYLEDKLFGTPTVRNKRSVEYDEDEGGMFDAIVDKLDGILQTYNQISQTPKCARLHMCRLVVEDYVSGSKSILSPLYMFGLGQLGMEKDASRFLQRIKNKLANGETVDCEKVIEGCTVKDKRKRKLP